MNQGEIVWARVPYSNLEKGKIRPALVVSNNAYNSRKRDVIVCAITSKLERVDCSVLIDNENLSAGQLPVKCRIRADKIMPVEKALLIKPFAKLDDRTFDALIAEIVKTIERRPAR